MQQQENKAKLHIKKRRHCKGYPLVTLKAKSGKVLEVNPAKYRAIVEGVNVVSKHTKPSATNPNGGIEKTEASVHISNLW